jgi:methylmalonyl-CoA mutase C-terminal domain/subunit
MELLKERGLNDVTVVVGGIIPDADVPKLTALGVAGVFQPGTPMQRIVDVITERVAARVE